MFETFWGHANQFERMVEQVRALGTKAFIESVFASQRWRFGPGRKDGERLPRGGASAWQGLRVLRSPRPA
jgi:hypothetical protein